MFLRNLPRQQQLHTICILHQHVACRHSQDCSLQQQRNVAYAIELSALHSPSCHAPSKLNEAWQQDASKADDDDDEDDVEDTAALQSVFAFVFSAFSVASRMRESGKHLFPKFVQPTMWGLHRALATLKACLRIKYSQNTERTNKQYLLRPPGATPPSPTVGNRKKIIHCSLCIISL